VFKKYIIIFLALTIAIPSAPAVLAAPVTITINASIEHQTINGMGGGMESHTEYENNSYFWDLLFNDIGVSAIKLSPLTGYLTEDPSSRFPMLRQAKSHGVQFFYVEFLSYPLTWKDSNDYLLPQYYSDVANHILNYTNYVKTNTGVDITDISMIDEPTFGNQGNIQRFKVTENEYINLLNTAGPIIKANSNLKIHIPDDWTIKSSLNYINTIMANPTAKNYVDVLSTHAYDWPHSSNPQEWQTLVNIAKNFNREVSCTEDWNCCGNPGPHPAGILTAQWMHEAFVDGESTSFIWWDMIDKGKYMRGFSRGLIYSKDWPPGEFTTDGITKQGYAFKQFARWVRPGAIRIDATSPDPDILVSSYKHLTNNTFTIVAINKGSTVKTVNVNINNYNSLSSLFTYRTSLTENTDYLGQVSVSNNSFSYDLPYESVMTFTGSSDVCDLVVKSVSEPPVSRKRGKSFSIKANITNNGTGAVYKEFRGGCYLSKNRDKRINNGADILLADDIIVSSLLAKASSKYLIEVSIPMNTPVGKYYVKVCADNRFEVAESNEDNNCRASTNKIRVNY
jgi:O-glycosyl hydrolase